MKLSIQAQNSRLEMKLLTRLRACYIDLSLPYCLELKMLVHLKSFMGVPICSSSEVIMAVF